MNGLSNILIKNGYDVGPVEWNEERDVFEMTVKQVNMVDADPYYENAEKKLVSIIESGGKLKSSIGSSKDMKDINSEIDDLRQSYSTARTIRRDLPHP